MKYLGETARAGGHDTMAAINDLAARGGPSPWRQALHLLWLALSRSGVRPEEYFTYALWRKDRGRAFLRGFLPNHRKREFNASFLMPDRGLAEAVMNDKLATETLLLARGLPVSRSRAVWQPPGAAALPELPGLKVLESPAALEGFLSDAANLPTFGKPRAESFARGAAVIAGLAAPGTLRFLTGATAPVRALAAEIAQDWGAGYLFQDFYQCAGSIRSHTGQAMASVRIVTLWTERGIEPWYAVIRLPARTAMHDGDALDLRIWGLIELETGRIARLRNLRDPLTPDLTHGHDPGRPFLGTTLPDWSRAVEICREGHLAFPGHGIIGWDVFLTDAGPLLNEANVTPGHLYQVAAQRPLLNPELRPAYERAKAFARLHGGGAGRF
ncbi:sugar-transfer associated ATP-grasp domain-containing protein [Tabrizicola soli]|uniref:Sugar-transfer associated ATP-grasp domain-containing protein n=1 Tax=Tabrizicola soli TaxID=2185115 RepID=A0ABV7DZ90_9RHOB|nr:sugar-transfer associated ATP-grasp domain-containing protein [Tabrizicola soli]